MIGFFGKYYYYKDFVEEIEALCELANIDFGLGFAIQFIAEFGTPQ
jgi:hypothetical protein